MKSVLLINGTSLFSEFLHEKFSTEQISLEDVHDREAYTKMISLIPDLIIIELSEEGISDDIIHLLRKKQGDPNVGKIPLIMAGPVIDHAKVTDLVEFGVVKYFAKPLKPEVLFDSIGKLIQSPFSIDPTPCILDVHLNGAVIFVEAALGLNTDKLIFLKYRLIELIEKHKIHEPKVILMMTNLQLSFIDGFNLEILLENVSAGKKIPNKNIKILTFDEFTRELIEGHSEFRGIQILQNIEPALGFITKQTVQNKEKDFIYERILTSDNIESDTEMEFIDSRNTFENEGGNMIHIAVVDNDIVVRKLLESTFSAVGGETELFENASSFFTAISSGKKYDVLVLELALPDMDGISVLRSLQRKNFQTPIVIYAKTIPKDFLVQGITLGVKGYLLKPQKPNAILNKVIESLHYKY